MSDAKTEQDKMQVGSREWRHEKHPEHFSAKKAQEVGSRAWYLQFHQELCQKMIEITAKKNADYTSGSEKDDAFANFRQVENMGTCSAEVGFLTRMTDKFSRINSFVKKGELQVKDEAVEDTLLDLANYCLLMLGYIKSKGKDVK